MSDKYYSQNALELQLLNNFFSFFKALFIVVWIGAGLFLLWPTLVGAFDLKIDLLATNGNENAGLVLEPMRPLSERENITAVVSYPTSPAEKVGGYYISGSFTTKDLRVLALQRYLRSKGSPMAAYAGHIVATSDSSGIDYRTFTAISGVESGYGRVGHAARVGHNPIGWRGGPGGKFNLFSGWNESVSYLVPRLARNYGSSPNPLAIQRRYCPPCEEAGTNEWANGVIRNLAEIDAVYKSL